MQEFYVDGRVGGNACGNLTVGFSFSVSSCMHKDMQMYLPFIAAVTACAHIVLSHITNFDVNLQNNL